MSRLTPIPPLYFFLFILFNPPWLNYYSLHVLCTFTIPNDLPMNHSLKLDDKLSFDSGTVGGFGLVSSSQGHISLGSLSQTTKVPHFSKHYVDTNYGRKLEKPHPSASPLPPLGSSSLSSSGSPPSSTSASETMRWSQMENGQNYDKINMRVMGQSIDPGIVNYLHPDVSSRNVKKLRKILMKAVDKDWTSETPPRLIRQRGISGSPGQNAEVDAKLIKDVQDLNFTFRNLFGSQFMLTEAQIRPFRYWLIEKATCEMDFIWEDLGPLFWPRWIRRGVCVSPPGQSCSWPPGMKCGPSGSRALQLLHWKCEDAAQVQSRERAADQRIRRRVSLNTFHSGFYDMEPEESAAMAKRTRKQRRDNYNILSVHRPNAFQSYRNLHSRSSANSFPPPPSPSSSSSASSPLGSVLSPPPPSPPLNHPRLPVDLDNKLKNPNDKRSGPIETLDPLSREEKRRRLARRLIKKLSITTNGYHCYWQVQKYVISDRCSCSCA